MTIKTYKALMIKDIPLDDNEERDVALKTDHLAVLAEKEGELWKLTYQLDMAQERTADLEKVVKVFQDDTVARKFHIEHLEEQIANLTKNRGEWQQAAETTRLHSTGGINGKRWDNCECPSCFLRMVYKAEIAVLKKERDEFKQINGDLLDANDGIAKVHDKLFHENARLQEREKVLIQRLQSHGDVETDK